MHFHLVGVCPEGYNTGTECTTLGAKAAFDKRSCENKWDEVKANSYRGYHLRVITRNVGSSQVIRIYPGFSAFI